MTNLELNTLSEDDNAALASVNVPLQPDDLLRFCQSDIERLFRINPYLEFKSWTELGNNHFHFSGINSSQEQAFDFDVKLAVEKTDNGLQLNYDNGLKQNTEFTIEPSEFGSRLTIREDYKSLSKQELDEYQTEIDRSLTTWAGDIQKFLIMWQQWQWFSPWRWYMNHVWKKLKPTGRRITYMFWWITLVEIALIALGALIYVLEYT